MELTQRKFGCIKDVLDDRDISYTLRSRTVYPASFSTQTKQPPITDQGSLGSCAAEGCTRLAKYGINKIPGQKQYDLSVLFDYWNARALENTTTTDAGSSIRDNIKALSQYGICQQGLWPYDESKVLIQPTPDAFKNALKFQALTYESLNNSDPTQIKDALFNDFPVAYGKIIYSNFQIINAKGCIPMPDTTAKIMGMHCMVICGWNDNLLGDGVGYFLEANSWSIHWGLDGYCWIPYTYTCNANLSSDFWTITKME